jgi:Fanconi anemia group J protein
MSSHHSVRTYLGHSQAWDLEDLVKVGKKVKACPYYAVRELKIAAQLVICPYNYLVEPGIRRAMEISLKDQVVVLDEAHNIEDSARDAASGTFELEAVTAAMQDCERMVECQVLPAVHAGLAAFCSRIGTWMQKESQEEQDYKDFDSSSRVWVGTRGIAEWNEKVFHPESYGSVSQLVQEALKEQKAATEGAEAGAEEGAGPVLAKKTTDLLEGVYEALEFMHRKDSVYRDDFRLAVVKAQKRKGPVQGKNGWVGRGDKGSLVSTLTLNFWCLNPAVCFDDLKQETRSIVLTSGTLSPMGTFASELDVKFPITLEANHVIDKSQVWVGTLAAGPTNYSLNATYRNANTFEFQDEVGRMVLEVCRVIPHGVLVFLPSYKMLNNLTERWQATGLWQKLFDQKHIITEPKFNDKLEIVMKEFYGVIEETSRSAGGVTVHGQTGALFLAVCRGKVSEGLDFADNNARAVICIGIPFPAIKDTLVDLKKKYNDKRRSLNRDTSLVSGNEWYEIQAFRALNQALGRCIRHKEDWGAILMVDDRYKKTPRYVQSLSKWVRGKAVDYDRCPAMLESLGQFAADMKHFSSEREAAREAEVGSVKAQASGGKTEASGDKAEQDGAAGRSAWQPSPGGLATTASKLALAKSVSLAQVRQEKQVASKLALEQVIKSGLEAGKQVGWEGPGAWQARRELALQKKQEKRKALGHLDNTTHLQTADLGAGALLDTLPSTYRSSAPRPRRPSRSKPGPPVVSMSSTSAVSISSTSAASVASEPYSASPSPTSVKVLPASGGRGRRKMEIISSDEDEPEVVADAKVSKLAQFAYHPRPTTLGVKRKKSESPERADFNLSDDCDFGLDTAVEAKHKQPAAQKVKHGAGWLAKPSVAAAVSKLPPVKPAEEAFMDEEDFDFDDEPMAPVPTASTLQVRAKDLTVTEDPYFEDQNRNTVKEQVEKEDAEDRALVEMMTRRRQRSGESRTAVVGAAPAAGSKQGFVNWAEVEPSRPAVGTRKPLFKQVEAGGGGGGDSARRRWSSGESVEEPRQVRTSLSSADEIEEPSPSLLASKPAASKLARRKSRPAAVTGRPGKAEDSDEDFR